MVYSGPLLCNPSVSSSPVMTLPISLSLTLYPPDHAPLLYDWFSLAEQNWWSHDNHEVGGDCTVLYCTVLYCTVLDYTVLYCTGLYCTALPVAVPLSVTRLTCLEFLAVSCHNNNTLIGLIIITVLMQ